MIPHLVMAKTGGPLMAVRGWCKRGFMCEWEDETGEKQRNIFPRGSLDIVINLWLVTPH